MALHAGFVGMFLVVAHVAMIFGMLDPTVLDLPERRTFACRVAAVRSERRCVMTGTA